MRSIDTGNSGEHRVLRGRLVACGLWVVSVLALAVSAAPVSAAEGSFQFGPLGSEAGQIIGVHGMAFDAEGDVYVADSYNERADRFAASGAFQFAWGWKVNAEAPAEELQTCTIACRRGEEGSGAGQFASQAGAYGIAVDTDSLSPSFNDVYVVDAGNYRVQKFAPEEVAGHTVMKFLLMFGGHVNQGTGGDVCVAGETCTRGREGTEDGEFNWAYERAYLAVGPGGDVYVGDKARVQVFEPSGAWKENISLAGLTSTGKVTALAVNAAGDVYVKIEGVPGVREFEPGGVEMPARLDEAGEERVEAIALDQAGNVFISENRPLFSNGACTCDFLEYSPSGAQLERFGTNTLMDMQSALAVDQASKELYVYGTDERENDEYGHWGVWSIPLPSPGPLITAGSEVATPELRGGAKLAASIDPEGNTTTVHFEYVDEAHFKESGFASAASTAPITLKETGFGEERVEAELPQGTLVPGATYHWRLVAVDTLNHTTLGTDESFEEIPAALVEGPWATNVSGTSATIEARIDPLGAATTYHLTVSGPSYKQAFSGELGEGSSYLTISHHVQELQGLTAYQYRLVTESEAGKVEVVHTFTTQLQSSVFTLPDGRAWELVSPADKKGALIGPAQQYSLTQAAADGSGITYSVNEPLGEHEAGHNGNFNQTLSMRGPNGWSSQAVGGKGGVAPEGTPAWISGGSGWEIFPMFSTTLSAGVQEQDATVYEQQSTEATERTLYLRDNASGVFTPLETEADAGAEFGDAFMKFWAATPDLSYVVFGTWRALTPEAVAPEPNHYSWEDEQNLYEWHAGKLQLVNVLPENSSAPGALLGDANGTGGASKGMTARAISADGRWVEFHYGDIGVSNARDALYVRDMTAKKTYKFGGSLARFETMSSDGSRIFFVETEDWKNGDLYVFDPNTGSTTDLTANHPGKGSAGVQDAVLGASESGSDVYFVATRVLASGGVEGSDNLYVAQEGANGWETSFIATLSPEDERTWGAGGSGFAGNPQTMIESEVSPNGQFLAFMSSRPLTGYDNRDALSGEPDEEVFLYDAAAKRLICASCNPTGARPIGVFDRPEAGEEESLLVDRVGAWWQGTSPHWLAASLVGWNVGPDTTTHQPRLVFDSGRLFFNAADALVAQDINGVEDVYEYEPAGVGGCTRESATFSGASEGCADLISSGSAGEESAFMDASTSGNDVFFAAPDRLTPEDYDTAYDIYDAHVCTSAVPCRTYPVQPPPCNSGDSCKAAPSPQPTLFGEPASETFNGAEDIVTHRGSLGSHGPKHCAKGNVRRKGRCVKRRRKRPRKRKHAVRRKGSKANGRGK